MYTIELNFILETFLGGEEIWDYIREDTVVGDWNVGFALNGALDEKDLNL